CYVKGKIEGKPAVMFIDSGCTNTLVHKKFLNHKKWTGNRITVLTATGERITVPLALLSFESEQANVPPTYDKEDWRDVEISDELDDEQKQQIKEMLEEYSDVLSGTPNMTNAAIHQIDTGDSTPIRGAPYKIPQKLEEEVNKEIEKMLALGIIRPSTSPWASPVVIVPKPDGTIRFCVDYRKLNEVTKMDAYPIPSMERMIEKVATAKYISTLDLTKGYWQIPLEETTIEKSAFITGKNLYEFVVMPFGMKTSPATFQRMMSEIVLKDFDFADAYIDDVEIDTSSSFTQHLVELEQVLQRLRECKLNARPSKCKIAMSSVDFVGHKTDHNPLVWLNQVREKSQKLLRWSITLQEYEMEIEHKPGKKNVNVDALSRE
ncbi:hypothetical protein QZH41_002963, partial [Actinostola sp. cb2023]